MTDIEKLRAFVRGYWENADNETRRGEPDLMYASLPEMSVSQMMMIKAFVDDHADFWYERGIKDLAEMVLAKLGEKE